MNEMPLISVIMPAYNAEETICASMLSVLQQTVKKLELIVADDCSIDRTPEIVTELASSDPRIKVLRNTENSGVASTRNYAIDSAAGELLAFLDSDDLWVPNKLEKQLSLLQKSGCGLCYSSYDYFDQSGCPIYRPYLVPKTINYEGLLKENIIGLSTVMLCKSAICDFRFDTELFHEDLALWLKLLRNGVIAYGVTDVLVHNRVGGRSNNKWKAMKNRWQIYSKSEGLSRLKSCWYLMFYVVAGLKKYRKRNWI